MYWNDDGMSGWGYGLMILNMLLFWGLVIAGIVFLVRYLGGNRQIGTGRDAANAERILAERFARGEIDEDEFQRRVHVLRRGGRTLAEH